MFLVTKSANSKIGNIAATYLPIKQTCPNSCALKETGCYARTSYVGMHVARLESQCEGESAYDLVRKEAREIEAYGPKAKGKMLRLHVSGDARTEKSAALLGNAAEKWNGKVYTYTHAWREVSRSAWKNVSVLASVENIDDAKLAIEKGYAPAIIVSHHESEKAYFKDGIKVIPCPSQTKNITCEQCRLCMNDKMLYNQKAVIAFAAHGVSKKKVLTVLK